MPHILADSAVLAAMNPAYAGEIGQTQFLPSSYIKYAAIGLGVLLVGLGAFLSGGLDSSIICALAIRHLGSLHTFSVGVEKERWIFGAASSL